MKPHTYVYLAMIGLKNVFNLSFLYYVDYENETSHACIKSMITSYDL